MPYAKEPHEILPFFFCGGMEILLVYFTLWTLAGCTACRHRAMPRSGCREFVQGLLLPVMMVAGRL